MPRTRTIAWSQLKVGIAGVVALLLVIVMVLAVGGEGGYFWERYALKARFNDVQGLKPGAVVRLSGKEIGVVTSVEFSGPQVEVAFEVLDDVQPLLTTESIAEIGSLSLLGEPIIEIRPGGGGRPLNEHEYIRASQSTGPIDELTSTASTSLEQVDGLLRDVRAGRGTLGKIVTDDALYNEMQGFVSAAAEVGRRLEQGRGTLGGLINDPAAYNSLKASLENLQSVTNRINTGQGALGKFLNDEAMGRSLSNTMSSAEQVTGRLSRGEGTAGKLLTDQELYNRLNSMAARIDAVAEGLTAGRGTAGQLLHDRQLYENMNSAVTELRNLLAEIRRDPQKYLRVNVSIF